MDYIFLPGIMGPDWTILRTTGLQFKPLQKRRPISNHDPGFLQSVSVKSESNTWIVIISVNFFWIENVSRLRMKVFRISSIQLSFKTSSLDYRTVIGSFSQRSEDPGVLSGPDMWLLKIYYSAISSPFPSSNVKGLFPRLAKCLAGPLDSSHGTVPTQFLSAFGTNFAFSKLVLFRKG